MCIYMHKVTNHLTDSGTKANEMCCCEKGRTGGNYNLSSMRVHRASRGPPLCTHGYMRGTEPENMTTILPMEHLCDGSPSLYMRKEQFQIWRSYQCRQRLPHKPS
jgi:hypothetical protein